jgi:membrane fusion protein, multidrug efflux system
MTRRQKWIAAAVAVLAVLAVLVIFVWLFGGRNGEGEGDEAEQVTSAPPKISRSAGGQVIVELSRDEQARIGLETDRVNAMTQSQAVTAYGVVLDPAPLAALDAELASTRAALAASRAEYERARLLHSENQNVSLKDLETARAKFQADQTQLNLGQQRLADEWGVQLSAMSPAARARLIDALTKRIAGIMRVSLPPGQPLSGEPKEARLAVLGYETQPLVTRTIWSAPTVDSHLQGQSFLLKVERQGFPLRPGTSITAYLESSGTAKPTVEVPEAAVVRMGDLAWAYVQIAPTQFERRQLEVTIPAASGWFVRSGFEAGDRVVVTGAQALLSEELKSQIQVKD